MKRKITIQTFNDGVISVYSIESVDNGSETLELKQKNLRFNERTVGINRYYRAKQDNVEITKVIRTPRLQKISTQDVVRFLNGEQYYIRRIVPPENVTPPCWDLSLERVVHDYNIN